MSRQPIALEAYETLAESYAARVDTKPHNACYERPATLSLLPDLDQPLDFLENGSFDIVLSALALDYVQDLGNTFREFHRVLRQSGLFVFSVDHPFDECVRQHTGNYFETELVDYEWTGFDTPVTVPSFRRPLGALVNPLVEAAFVLEHLPPSGGDRGGERDPFLQ